MKKTATAFLIAVLLASSPALAAAKAFSDGSAESIVFDTVVVRPAGIVMTALGGAAFVVTLPFTFWDKERMAKTGDALVSTPAKYTFTRPLGEDF